MAQRAQPLRHFVQTRVFEKTAISAGLGERELIALEEELRDDPYAGATVSETGGARKVRVALAGRGKSGGARVLYFYNEPRDTIYFLLAYPKNVQPNLTRDQKKLLRMLVVSLE